jgi:hypothetical protein
MTVGLLAIDATLVLAGGAARLLLLILLGVILGRPMAATTAPSSTDSTAACVSWNEGSNDTWPAGMDILRKPKRSVTQLDQQPNYMWCVL